MHIPTFIERKRDGHEASAEDIEEFIRGFTSGRIPDYQMTAWAMAVFFRGLTPAETRHLTRSMMRSGQTLSFPSGSPPKVDKHSTGGVGDKVSLVLAPLLACGDVWVPMVSGRGLGITGGTLDKLESIPGFRVSLSLQEAGAQLERLGVFMIGQTDDFCPADRRLYALRDVTATVPSQPLIVASIMSKKLAENLDRLVLDVKWGAGAFMKNRQEASVLAGRLEEVAREIGVRVSSLITPMEEPLGTTVGNALEVAEAVAVLKGEGPNDLLHLTLDLAQRVTDVPRATLQKWLQDGTAWQKWVALVEAQGGDASATERMAETHPAPVTYDLPAPDKGRIARVDAGLIGRACVELGAGRAVAGAPIDPAVGFSAIKKVGQTVERGEAVFRIHAHSDEQIQAVLPLLKRAVRIA